MSTLVLLTLSLAQPALLPVLLPCALSGGIRETSL